MGRKSARVPDFTLTDSELRTVAAFALAAASEVLPLFESQSPGDQRPREALAAARAFAGGDPRSVLQRVTATAAHRAARATLSAAALHAGMAAGDAAAAAYLHPLADEAQVKHILRAGAHALCAIEHANPGRPEVVEEALVRQIERATPSLRSVLSRYPRVRQGRQRVAELMFELDVAIR